MATVKGMYMTGKNIVSVIGSNFEIIDLGVMVPPKKIQKLQKMKILISSDYQFITILG